jgi:hypothetical protein
MRRPGSFLQYNTEDYAKVFPGHETKEGHEISRKYSKNLVPLSIFNSIDIIPHLAVQMRFLVQNKNLLDFKNLWI